MMFKSPYGAKPIDIQDVDRFAFMVVAVAGTDKDWAAYRLPIYEEKTDTLSLTSIELAHYCESCGDKISEEAARGLFYALANSGRMYRE